MTIQKIICRVCFGIFVGLSILQISSKIYAQKVEYICVHLQTGEKVKCRAESRRFTREMHADGVIAKTNIRFNSNTFITNDEQKLTKLVYHSESVKDTKKYFKSVISTKEIIIKDEKIRKDNKAILRRLIIESKEDDISRYEIFLYDGGKSFTSIVGKNLDLIIEFESYLKKNSK